MIRSKLGLLYKSVQNAIYKPCGKLISTRKSVTYEMCRSTRMSFLPSSSQAPYRLFPCKHEKRTHYAAPPLPKKSYDFSGTPKYSAVALLISSQNHIPFGRSFSCKRQNKKPLHRHQKSAGALLSLQNDVLCNGFEIQRRDCFAPIHSLTVPKSTE